MSVGKKRTDSEVEAKKKNGLKQIVKREFGGNMTLRETSAVQEPVVVLCGTRRRDSQKPNHYTKLKCSGVNSKSHDEDTVFSEKIPCVQQKNLPMASKNTSKAFPRCSVNFTCNMEADGSSKWLANFPSQYMTSHAGSTFLLPV